MPNPLVNVSAIRGKFRTNREPMQPVPEGQYRTTNHPYRGTEEHGVEITDDDGLYPDYADGHDEGGRLVPVYEHPEPVSEPVPVYVVHGPDNQREFRRWRTGRPTISARTDALTTQIVGRSDQRTTVTIINTDAAKTVYIGPDRDVLSTDGYPLGPGKEKTLTSEDGLYALSADGTPVVCGVIIEYSVTE